MRSVRLNDEMEQRLRRAAAIEGLTVSEFIRRAAADRADQTLSGAPADRLADVLGTVRSSGGQARRSAEAFTDAVGEKRRRARR